MESTLERLLDDGVISEIFGRLKSGKEADVYVVRYAGEVVAAKVYKDRAQRNFKNNALYKEGRAVRNTRSQRAMDKGSKFGKDTAEDTWKSTEANTLYKLHAAGVRVPTPVMFVEGVLLMELVRGVDDEAAPRLIDAELSPDEANAGYMDMLGQLVRILSCDLIHGDLSPYNVLLGAAGPTIIDFPQIVSASANSNSERFFLRDARNILGHFSSIDRRLAARRGDPEEIWRAYVRRELSPEFLPTGRFVAPRPPPQQERGARPPVQDRGARAPVQDRGARPPAQDRGPRPPAQDRGARPPAQDRGPRPPAQDRGPRPQVHDRQAREQGPRQGSGAGPGPRDPHRGAPPERGARNDRPVSNDRGAMRGNGGPSPGNGGPPRGHGQQRPRPAPEVIVMSRRGGGPAPEVPAPVAQPSGGPGSEEASPSRRRRRRPRRG